MNVCERKRIGNNICVFFIYLLLQMMLIGLSILCDSDILFFAGYIAILLGAFSYGMISKYKEILLVIPVIFSVFQNVFLGIAIKGITEQRLQFLVIFNFLYSIMILGYLVLYRLRMDSFVKAIVLLFVIICAYAFALVAIREFHPIAFVSSLRNIIAPFLFLLIGYLIADEVSKKNYMSIVLAIGVICLIVGFYEFFINKRMWMQLNIAELWPKKGIEIASYGLPRNFFSSEQFRGNYIQRMSSTFADPVNLGTFLFAVFMLAWYKKRYVISALTLLGCVMVVSKGALLGILVFVFFAVCFSLHRKIVIPSVTALAGAAMIVVIYILNNSSGSMRFHIMGFLSSIIELKNNILGYGVGNIGVLSGLFHSGVQSKISETGLGLVIGQLGIVGLVVYVALFIIIFAQCFKQKEKKDRIFCASLVVAIGLNIVFNEVALSPNSCAIYFLLLGLFIKDNGREKLVNKREV